MTKRLYVLIALLSALYVAAAVPAYAQTVPAELPALVCETTNTTGTDVADVDLEGAVTSYRSFADGATNGDRLPINIVTSAGPSRRVLTGWGTYVAGSPDRIEDITADASTGESGLIDLSGTSRICVDLNASFFADGVAKLDVDTVTVTTEAYDATGWNADETVPTKDAVRDLIEGGVPLANAGDSATAFFSTGTIEDARIDGSAEVDEVLNSDLGDFTCSAGSCAIDTNAVALGTDTTGNYALGDAEGGAATTGDSATSFFSTGILESSIGGTGNGFTKFSGPASSEKTFTLPNASSSIEVAGKRTIWVPAGAMYGDTTNPASCGDTYDSGSNDLTLKVCAFDTGVTEERSDFVVTFPKSYNNNTVTVQFFWTNASGANSSVAWEVGCVHVRDDDTLNATVGTTQTTVDAWIATNDLHVSAASSALTCGGTWADGATTFFRINRDTSNASDAMAGDALLTGVKIIFSTNAANDD